MTASTDRILSVIDAGLQTPVPDPTFGEVSPERHGRCARCERNDPAEGGDMCAGCRAFLLGDSDADPAQADETHHWVPEAAWQQAGAASATDDAFRRHYLNRWAVHHRAAGTRERRSY